MYDTKLMNLLIHIVEEDNVTSLHKFLKRQYEKSDSLEFQLWEHLKKHIVRGGYSSNRLSSDYIVKDIFNNDKKSLNRTASRLYQRVKMFMIEIYLDENRITQDWLFRESLKQNKSRIKDLMTDKLINDERKPANKIEDSLQLFIKFHLNYEKYQEQSLVNSDVRLFNKARELFKEYYIRYYGMLEIELRQRKKMFGEEVISLTALDEEKIEIVNEVEVLFENAKRLEENPNMEDFEYCKNTFLRLLDDGKVSREMQLTIFTSILNFANRQSKKGDRRYFIESIDYFIKLGLGRKILYTKDKIPVYIYSNFLSFVAGVKHLNDIKRYTQQYVEDVDEENVEKAKFFSTLFIEFYSENYQQVIDNIIFNENDIKIGFEPTLRTRVWVFLVCSYFEVKNEELLMKSISGFRRYLNNQTISDISVIAYFNLIRFIKDIFRARSIERLDEIKAELINEKLITYDDWLNKN